jgi:hypothetical protein
MPGQEGVLAADDRAAGPQLHVDGMQQDGEAAVVFVQRDSSRGSQAAGRAEPGTRAEQQIARLQPGASRASNRHEAAGSPANREAPRGGARTGPGPHTWTQ